MKSKEGINTCWSRHMVGQWGEFYLMILQRKQHSKGVANQFYLDHEDNVQKREWGLLEAVAVDFVHRTCNSSHVWEGMGNWNGMEIRWFDHILSSIYTGILKNDLGNLGF